MNSVPALLILAVGVFAAIVTAGRWLLVRDSSMDRLLNRLWSWEIGGFLLHGIANAAGAPELGRRLFLGCGLMAGAAAYGFARLLFDGQARYTERDRQRWYDTTAAVAAATLVLAESFLDDLLPFRWATAVWAMVSLAGGIAGYMMLHACIRELRSGGLTIREKLLFGALLVLAVYWTCGSTIGSVRTLFGVPPAEPGRVWTIITFATFAGATALLSVRLIDVLSARLGWDRASRHCRRLGPMWRDLTSAVPEVVLAQDDSADPDPAHRRYRMTVEIWDALLQLRPYVPDTAAVPGPSDNRGYALVLARAGRAKARGAPPATRPGALVLPRPADRTSELRMLLGLARVWPSDATYNRRR
ncbi:MAB_1171c family putative transporter [Nocardia brasiliensis]|uniref:MAB_1171c family putative transporter n=1 Tax=Nocardia brasiliensis TaxID=37326 RepID=UPI0004A75D38|nr:MAB_1171c family putative transporter [Nocardia brasiliensis]